MLQECDTGDIILFDNPMQGTAFIKYATRSKWDHVGMILKYNNKPEETILIESANCGVFIAYAEQRLRQVLDDPAPTVIGWRKLIGPNHHQQWKKAVHEYAESLINTPYEQNFSDFVKAWIGDSQWSKTMLGATKGEDLDSVFCSELCAAIFKHAHVLDPSRERDSNAYSPKDFASQSNSSLTLSRPWELRQEVEVTTAMSVGGSEMKFNREQRGGSTPSASGRPINTLVDQRSQQEVAQANQMNMQRFVGEQALDVAQRNGDEATAAQARQVLSSLPPKPVPQQPEVQVQQPQETIQVQQQQQQGAKKDKQKSGCCA